MTMTNNKNQKWTVKKPDGNVYGPADIETIKRWIQEKRILARPVANACVACKTKLQNNA